MVVTFIWNAYFLCNQTSVQINMRIRQMLLPQGRQLSSILNKLSIRRGCGEGRWWFGPPQFSNFLLFPRMTFFPLDAVFSYKICEEMEKELQMKHNASLRYKIWPQTHSFKLSPINTRFLSYFFSSNHHHKEVFYIKIFVKRKNNKTAERLIPKTTKKQKTYSHDVVVSVQL